MTPDSELVRHYAQTHSEDAFAELVRRHLPLVYSAALRQVNGDAHLAQDVTQMVFSDLARKSASLARREVLEGWLYTSAHFAAAQAVRTERRRHVREQEAHLMRELSNATAPDLDWDQLGPMLDEVMHELNEKDRDAILMRYFKNLSLAEIGAKIGLSENAARMRVDRALERLRGLLARRGITTTAAAVASTVLANAVQLPPAGLSLTVTSGSLAAVTVATASTSTWGIITLITSAKLTSVIAAVAVLLFVGGAAVKFYKSNSGGTQAAVAPANEPKTAAVAADSNRVPARRGLPTRATVSAETNLDLAAALARVKEVLNDPQPTTRYPGSAMQEAIAALGDQRKAAVPMLREALKKESKLPTMWEYQVRRRAIGGLGLIGPDAREAAPDFVEILRSDPSTTSAMENLTALGRIGPLPDMLPDLVRLLKQHPKDDARQFIAHFLPTIVGGDSTKVDELLKPLLHDSDLQVRAAAVSALVTGFKRPADLDMVNVVAESLKSYNPNAPSSWLPTSEMLGVLKEMVQDRSDPQRVTAAGLGSAATSVIAALIYVADSTKEEMLKAQAMKLLDVLAPGLRRQNPAMDAFLREQEQIDGFRERIHNGQATVSEMIEGLSRFPNMIGPTAEALGRLGSDAKASLPSLQEMLAGLEPKSGASATESASIYSRRATIANAIQKIAPDQPKLLFTSEDVAAVIGIWTGSKDSWQDKARGARISRALQPTARYGSQLEPAQMRSALEEIKAVDEPAYQAAVAAVQKIDPHFFDNTKQ